MGGFVYILSNENKSFGYIGVTSDVPKRLYEHKNEVIDGFTKTYHVHALVYVERYEHMEEAIAREKQLKKWSRKKKEILIGRANPTWKDLSKGWK